MGVNKKGGLVGGFDQLRAPDAPTISVASGDTQVTVTITNPSDTGGGDRTKVSLKWSLGGHFTWALGVSERSSGLG